MYRKYWLQLYYAYVDGSFIEGCTGYGAVILKAGNIVVELSGKVDTPRPLHQGR